MVYIGVAAPWKTAVARALRSIIRCRAARSLPSATTPPGCATYMFIDWGESPNTSLPAADFRRAGTEEAFSSYAPSISPASRDWAREVVSVTNVNFTDLANGRRSRFQYASLRVIVMLSPLTHLSSLNGPLHIRPPVGVPSLVPAFWAKDFFRTAMLASSLVNISSGRLKVMVTFSAAVALMEATLAKRKLMILDGFAAHRRLKATS